MQRIGLLTGALALIVVCITAVWPQQTPAPSRTAPNTTVPLRPPAEETIPKGPLGDAVRYGRNILTHTQVYAKQYVGNGLNCSSCHLDGGLRAYSSPWVGIWAVYPEYRSRNAKVNTLEDRINDCFERSMNGKALPLDSNEMHAILTFLWWLSKDVPIGVDVEGRGFIRIKSETAPDPVKGKELYATKCAACHGVDGEGMTGPNGEYLFPALWGEKSFNIGAGMARLNTAAAFVKANMPFGQGNTLTDQEAFDVAAYFTQQPRPDFAEKYQDWPKGGKPADTRY